MGGRVQEDHATLPIGRDRGRLTGGTRGYTPSYAAPTEETVRGFSGVRLLVADEAARVSDALHFLIRPMLAVSGGRMVCLTTPFDSASHASSRSAREFCRSSERM